MKLLLFLLLLILTANISFAQVRQKPDVEKSKREARAAKMQKDSIIAKFKRVNDKVYKIMQVAPAPIISYSTETSWLFGLAKFNAFDLNKEDTISNASSVGATIGASFKGQMFLNIGTHFYWSENKNVAELALGLEKFPRAFWGTGNDINPDTSKLVTKSFFQTVLKYKRMVIPNIYIGAKYSYYNVFHISYTVDSIYKPKSYKGSDGGVNSGFGLILAYDSRDNTYNASKGWFAEFQTEFYSKAFGSEFVFNRYILDIRKFHQVGNFVFAYQFYSEANYGNIPVYSMALMGGTERMRGYYQGQYRDNVIIDGQFEIRRHLFWLIGGVAFVSMGEVAPYYSDFKADNIKLTAGGGLRLMVDQEHKTNLRFDFGVGKNTYALFFGFSEAF